MDIVIDKAQDGLTVLEYIKRNLTISSAHLKHLKFSEGGITVNAEHATVRRVLREGDILSLATEDREVDCNVKPVELPLDIIYEDGECIVPSKPPNMPTHPSHDHYDDTVANALAYRYAQTGAPFVFRPVNRLDRNTSGLLLIAKNRIAAGRLSGAMSEGRIKKAYIAILSRILPEDEGVIETYMRRTAESIIVRENCKEGEGGDHALTRYKTLLKRDNFSVVAASPVTGRTHQLRVHFSGLSAPILGDDMYGDPSPIIGRHALHSAVLSFPDSNGETVRVSAPIPEDMENAIEKLFENGVDSRVLVRLCEDFLSEHNEIR